MPKKTKKQKILAQLHRNLQFSVDQHSPEINLNAISVKNQNINSIQSQAPTYSTSTHFANEAVMKAKTIKIDSSYDYVKQDLIKITIFTAFALILQGVLYFLLRTR